MRAYADEIATPALAKAKRQVRNDKEKDVGRNGSGRQSMVFSCQVKQDVGVDGRGFWKKAKEEKKCKEGRDK